MIQFRHSRTYGFAITMAVFEACSLPDAPTVYVADASVGASGFDSGRGGVDGGPGTGGSGGPSTENSGDGATRDSGDGGRCDPVAGSGCPSVVRTDVWSRVERCVRRVCAVAARAIDQRHS